MLRKLFLRLKGKADNELPQEYVEPKSFYGKWRHEPIEEVALCTQLDITEPGIYIR